LFFAELTEKFITNPTFDKVFRVNQKHLKSADVAKVDLADALEVCMQSQERFVRDSFGTSLDSDSAHTAVESNIDGNDPQGKNYGAHTSIHAVST
jgi:hypothetical protein